MILFCYLLYRKTDRCVAKIHHLPSKNRGFARPETISSWNTKTLLCNKLPLGSNLQTSLLCAEQRGRYIANPSHAQSTCKSTCFKSPVIDEPKRPALTLICDSADFCGHLFSHVLLQHTHIYMQCNSKTLSSSLAKGRRTVNCDILCCFPSLLLLEGKKIMLEFRE